MPVLVGVVAPLRFDVYPQVKRPPLGAELIVARLGGRDERDSPLFLLDELAEVAADLSIGEARTCPRSLLTVPILVAGRAVDEAAGPDLLDSPPAVADLVEAGLG